jgi:glutathione S-transferase
MAKAPKKAAKKVAAKKIAKKPAPKKVAKPAKTTASKGPSAAENQRFTLYGFAGSAPTYTAALGLALMRHPFSYIHISLRDGQHKMPDYIVKNRFGQVPALRDGQSFFVQSAAILIHLAESLDKMDGKTTVERQRVREWLFWQWDKLALPVFRLRQRARGFRQFGEEVRMMYDGEARAGLAVLDAELAKSEWIVGKKPTIADIGLYVCVRLTHDANVDLGPFHHIQAWRKRFEALPGFATPEQLLPMESRLI